MPVVSDHNKLLKDAMKKIGPITNMSKFIADWVEKSFGMTAMMPDEPEIQANVTVLYEIEKETSNTSKNKEELNNDQKQQQDHLLANPQTKFLSKERRSSTKTTRQTSCTA